MKEYICECNKIFTEPNKYNGHKRHCRIHLLNTNKLDKIIISDRESYNKLKIFLDKKHSKDKEDSLNKWLSEKHKCEKCGTIMTVKFGSGRFCSKSCANSHSLTRETRLKIKNNSYQNNIDNGLKKHRICKKAYEQNPNKCTICGKDLSYETRYNKACSKECRSKLFSRAGKNSSIKQRNNRRSKNEIFFFNLCIDYFKNKNFLIKHNDVIVNGWDADIIIENIKYAILWNRSMAL